MSGKVIKTSIKSSIVLSVLILTAIVQVLVKNMINLVDIQVSSMLKLIALFFSTYLILKTIIKSSKTNSSNKNKLPPGPWKFPFIGNIHNLIGSLPHRSLRNLALRYGPVLHLRLGEVPFVIVSSPESAKEIMKTHDLNFASRPSIIVAEIISYNCTSITFGPYGDHWRQLRKFCTLELLSVKRVQSFRSIREEVFLDLVKWMALREGSVINLTEKLYSSTYGVILKAVIGDKSKEGHTLLPIIMEVIELGAGFDIAELFPSVKLFQMISRLKKRVTKLHKEADRILDDIIREHKTADVSNINDNHECKSQEDLLDVLLKIQEDGLEIPLTMENIKAVLVDMLGAGSETSATVMNWAMSEMLRDPRILKRVQDEVRQIFDEKGHVDESNIHQLVYLKSIVKETLRLHPPLPLLLPRKCGQECEINGYKVPEDTKVLINAWAINRDPKYWEDAEVFKPERFIDSSVDYKGNHFEYIPFGAGRRMCPGISFGLANVELPLAMLLFHFDWKLSNGDIDMTETFGTTARRKYDLCVVPTVVKRPY